MSILTNGKRGSHGLMKEHAVSLYLKPRKLQGIKAFSCSPYIRKTIAKFNFRLGFLVTLTIWIEMVGHAPLVCCKTLTRLQHPIDLLIAANLLNSQIQHCS